MRKKHNYKICNCASCKSVRGEYNDKNNPFYGRKHTKITKEKISKNHADVSKENNPFWKEERIIDKKYYCKDCDKIIHYNAGIYGSGRCRQCIEKYKKYPSRKGKLNNSYGKPIRPNWGKYKNINMRSSYEIKFAFFLDCSDIKWLYESKTFDLGNTTYTPDFYLPSSDCYIETKGYFSDKAKKKFKKFERLYPNINIKVLMQPDLQELGIL